MNIPYNTVIAVDFGDLECEASAKSRRKRNREMILIPVLQIISPLSCLSGSFCRVEFHSPAVLDSGPDI